MYEWYRRLSLEWMGLDEAAEDPRPLALSALTVAVCDGLSTQLALHPSGLDVHTALAFLEGLIGGTADELRRAQ